jgi:hypothetical protein
MAIGPDGTCVALPACCLNFSKGEALASMCHNAQDADCRLPFAVTMRTQVASSHGRQLGCCCTAHGFGAAGSACTGGLLA